ncbi:MAG: transcription antitermination factor NusB [Gammaproteobacteria bacterium PRO9]|nr:transcription antitermination factor NusB [Gammaproteobacteria bacterium PRO9]
MAATGRQGSRRLLVQALYQHQLAGHEADELLAQFGSQPDFQSLDGEYFRQLLVHIVNDKSTLDGLIAQHADRPLSQLDPVEHGILWLGMAELLWRPDVPVRVVITEAVQLARQFGAQDGHRYINALLDRAAAVVRAVG